MTRAVWLRLTGDTRTSDLAPVAQRGYRCRPAGVHPRALLQSKRDRQPSTDAGAATGDSSERPWWVQLTATTIRERSLRIFDRSFAVSHWLHRRHRHSGVGRQLQRPGAGTAGSLACSPTWASRGGNPDRGGEQKGLRGRRWSSGGRAAGAGGVRSVLVHVVNPRSFHWTMDLAVPGKVAGAVRCRCGVRHGDRVAGGAGGGGEDAVMAVKEGIW